MAEILEKREDAAWRRARRPEQQELRRQEILDAAYELFRELEYEEVSLNAIAREAGLSKSSVYLYFQTREEIFLEIYIDSFRKWAQTTITAWKKLPPDASPHEVITSWMDVSWADSRMSCLQPLVATSIERNVSDEKLADCLRMKREEIARFHRGLCRFFPGLTADAATSLVIHAFSLFSQYRAYDANPALARVFSRPEFAGLRRGYKPMVIDALTTLLESNLNSDSTGDGRVP